MAADLSGKWVWQWPRADSGDPIAVAARLHAAGCRGALVKAYDGPRWFSQGWPWREICRALKAQGLLVGGWGYHYGQDAAGEARLAVETATYGEADLLVLDVESEFEGRPWAAAELVERLRVGLGGRYPVYFSTFALPRYHRSFPFAPFVQACQGAVPQLYWNAFRLPMRQALAAMYEDYGALGLRPERLFPAAGLYQEGTVPYPEPAVVADFVRLALARGSRGVSFWSYQHMDGATWEAVATVPILLGEEEMASLEEQIAALSERLSRLEARVADLEGRGACPPPSRRAPSNRGIPSGPSARGWGWTGASCRGQWRHHRPQPRPHPPRAGADGALGLPLGAGKPIMASCPPTLRATMWQWSGPAPLAPVLPAS